MGGVNPMTKKLIERCIYEEKDISRGHYYYFVHPVTRTKIVHSTLAEEQKERRYYDWQKKLWTVHGCNHDYMPIGDSKVRYDAECECWYCYKPLIDDILVSQQYYSKFDAKRIQKYLDKHDWSLKALSREIKYGLAVTHKYSNILPTQRGYLVVDNDKNEYGCFEKLEDAYQYKIKLINGGVDI